MKKVQLISDRNKKSLKIKSLLLKKNKLKPVLQKKFDYCYWWRWFYAPNSQKKQKV